MDKSFEPKDIEQRWYDYWEKQKYFAPSGEGENHYCILIPPPNVTGTLHMGHAFQHTLMDALVRYHRMRGDNTLWQPGTDHAGIATQMVVERQLQADGQSRHDLGREKFIDRVWEWKAYSGSKITSQMRRLGDSTDWNDEWFTMDGQRSCAVTEVFVRLHEDGLVEKRKRLVNWDPTLHTAISDLEVISQEEEGHLWHFRYPIENSEDFVVVATTRPETMLGDTAVAIHPEDERYSHLKGKFAVLPLTGRRIPIIVDDYVDPEFGSGCVKITPAHDFNDWDLGQRHKLEVINLFTPNADMNDNVPEKYRGMDRDAARKQVVADLKDAGNLVRVEKHKLVVPRGDRTGAIVEPYLTDQWYLKMDALAKPAIDAVTNGDIKFVPDNWKNTYFHWMNNLQDWCISRQLWWGHRIPAWYDPSGNIYVGRSESEIRDRHSLADEIILEQDQDVLDTWFSSALLPFTTLDWDGKKIPREQWLPTDVLVTGFDIIFFWVARMIMMTLKFTGKVPFKEIYITGLIRDDHGQKMSKSKGNILDPIDLIDGIGLDALLEKRTTGLMQPHLKLKIEKNTRQAFPEGIKPHGTDALRFTLTALASPSRDINFDLRRLEGYRNFCNKLWNASRYVLMNTEGEDCSAGELSAADMWIRHRLGQTIKNIEESLAKYRFDLAAKELHEFTWSYFCDWYLELSKPLLQSAEASPEQKRGTRHTLITVLETLLRISHPFMPFITEEIWQRVAPLAGVTGESIMVQAWPASGDFQGGNEFVQAESAMEWVMQFIEGVRKIRGDLNISPTKTLPVLLEDMTEQDKLHAEQQAPLLKFVARLEKTEWHNPGEEIPQSATALLGKMIIHVPIAGLVDTAAELERLKKQLDKVGKELKNVQTKLANKKFVHNAPAEVVAKEKLRAQELAEKLEQIQQLSIRIAKI